MNFIDINKQKPNYMQRVLFKFLRGTTPVYSEGMLVTDDYVYVEHYVGFGADVPMKYVIGWMPIEELDKIEVE